MQKQSRIQKSIKNSFIALVSQGVILLAQFTIQTVFVKILGAQYLGANGLFSNILSFLSFAELGIGTAITYSLYKPLAENDHRQIAAIMNLFRRAYIVIGFVILAFGFIFSFFVPLLINKNSGIPHVQGMFLIFLLNSGVSYFFTYKRTLLIANQQGYIDNLNRVIFTSLQTVAQVVFLILTHAYVTYLIIQVVFTILSNISLSFRADRLFPYLKEFDDEVSKGEKSVIGKNVLGAIASKIGTIVAYGTDNILISKFIGLGVVGAYSNYMLILTSIQNIANQMLNAVVASIANFSNTESKEKEEDIFYDYLFLVAFIAFVLSISVYAVVQFFIKFWVGKSYVLNEFTVLLLVFNWFINVLRSSILGFMSVHGLYWETRWKSIVESVVNLFVGLVLISFFKLGVNSVILGTLSANVFVNMWWEPLILLKKGVSTSFFKYYKKYLYYVIINSIMLGVVYFVHINELLTIHSLFQFVIYGISIVAGCTVLFSILNFRSEEFKFYLNIVRRSVHFKE